MANPHPVLTLEFLISYVNLCWKQPYSNASFRGPGFTDADPQDKTFKSDLCTCLICMGKLPHGLWKSWLSAQQKQEEGRQPGLRIKREKGKKPKHTWHCREVAVNVLWTIKGGPALTLMFSINQHRSPPDSADALQKAAFVTLALNLFANSYDFIALHKLDQYYNKAFNSVC